MVRLAPRLFAVLLLVVALVAIPTGAPAQQPDGGTKYALVVGIDAYEDAKRLPRLSYAEADAKALAQVLEDQKVEVTLLLGKAASKKGIEAAFDAILARGTARDTLLVAFAGHGQQFRPAGEMEDVPFLCAADCTATRADTQVRLNALLAKAGDAKVGKALFLIDACRTDPGAQSGVTGNAVSVKAQTEVLFAAANGQKAREHADAGGKGSGHGLFMSEVIAALRGEAKNRRGEVTWNGLVAHITGEVTAKSKELFPALEDGQHQTPHKLGSLAGEVVLARLKDSAVAPPVPKDPPIAPPPMPKPKPKDPPIAPPPMPKTSDTAKGTNPVVVLETSLGTIEIELFADKAPGTVRNFLGYVADRHYDGLIFHRVLEDFMIQGGGFVPGMKQTKTREPIKNESDNGLSNARGTVAMARLGSDRDGVKAADSATSQFFINVGDNSRLDQLQYCVFGKVVKGMDVVDKIRKVRTHQKNGFDDVPVDDVVIKSVTKK